MIQSLLAKILHRPSRAFLRAARARGVSGGVALTLEPAAREVSPANPMLVLESRELFEQAAMQAVVGDARNLELSFSLVDSLSTTVEKLGLTRSVDPPDPFRRVWVGNEEGLRMRGVVLTCEGGEVAVFCPPTRNPVPDAGAVLQVRYRGVRSMVQYELLLDDAVRLPGALVLHLTRVEGRGAIGRTSERFDVDIPAQVCTFDQGDVHGPTGPCQVADTSEMGLGVECAMSYEQGQAVSVEMGLPFRDRVEPFRSRAVVSWVREGQPGTRRYGLSFTDLHPDLAERLTCFIEELSSAAPVSPDVAEA